jgi:hypothetical protein
MNPDQTSGTDDDRREERRKQHSQCVKEYRARQKAHVETMQKRIDALDEENLHLRQAVSALQRENASLKTKLEIVKKDCFWSADRSNAGNDIGDKLLQSCVEQQLDASCTSVSHHMFFQPTPTNNTATPEYDDPSSKRWALANFITKHH